MADQTINRALSDARDRGEIDAAPVPDRAATAIVALVRNEVFFTRNLVDQTVLTDILDNVYLLLIQAVSRRADLAGQSELSQVFRPSNLGNDVRVLIRCPVTEMNEICRVRITGAAM